MAESRVLIALATFNRPVISELCLKSLQAVRGEGVRLVVYDDASSAYDRSYLAERSDEVVRFHRNGGIERSRARAMRDFVHRFREYEVLYLTDNDTIHDPSFVGVLRELFEHQAGVEKRSPVCLYNSCFHSAEANRLSENALLEMRRTAPGVSQGYDRRMVECIVRHLDLNPELETVYGWDYYWPALLGVPFIQTKVSYVEHFARDREEAGLHAENSGKTEEAMKDFERDRAINPTRFLREIRPAVMAHILGLF